MSICICNICIHILFCTFIYVPYLYPYPYLYIKIYVCTHTYLYLYLYSYRININIMGSHCAPGLELRSCSPPPPPSVGGFGWLAVRRSPLNGPCVWSSLLSCKTAWTFSCLGFRPAWASGRVEGSRVGRGGGWVRGWARMRCALLYMNNFAHVSVCVCVYECECVYIYIYIYLYIYMCVCICKYVFTYAFIFVCIYV